MSMLSFPLPNFCLTDIHKLDEPVAFSIEPHEKKWKTPLLDLVHFQCSWAPSLIFWIFTNAVSYPITLENR